MVLAGTESGLVPDLVTTFVAGIGLAIVITAKMTLGRSFGVVPANRGVVVGGMYRFVRHPIYAGYLIVHLGFALAHPTAWNLIVFAIADAALIVRALREERVLVTDRAYEAYCQRVRWHLIPAVF
jgi:protein-S-isoprenylcysteine O-methyltransferase Ste14